MERIWMGTSDGPPYAVLCVDPDDEAGDGHIHVSAVETRDPDGGQTRWTAAQVIAAIRDGERFVVAEDGQGKSLLRPVVCGSCPTMTLVVDPPGPFPAPCG
jgi:hypothetical protein